MRLLTPEEALARVELYRGSRLTSDAVVRFTRDAVRDTLPFAPDPVNRAWIAYATSVVGTLARVSEEQGLPLDRAVVLDRARIDRFLAHDCAHLTAQSRSSYRSVLDRVAVAVLNGQSEAWPRAVFPKGLPTEPWDDAQAARVALWTCGSRPRSRQDRLRALLALTLGAGLRRQDLGVAGHHVHQDADGVHVAVPAMRAPNHVAEAAAPVGRTVTVAAAWEQEVLLAADRAGDNLLVAPTRAEMNLDSLTAWVLLANRDAPAGDEFVLSRARNTWLVRHLAAGTPLPLLMQQAGLSSAGFLVDLLAYVPLLDPAAPAAMSFMRGV